MISNNTTYPYAPEWEKPNHVKVLQTTKYNQNHETLDFSSLTKTKNTNLQLIDRHQIPHYPYTLQQIHGNNLIELHHPPNRHQYAKADGCFTHAVQTVCTVITADCLPVLFTNESGTIVGSIHCGWRSLAAGIIDKTFKRIKKPPEQLLVWLGPCVGAEKYQVKADMVEQFLDISQQPELEKYFTADNHKSDSYIANLRGIAKAQWLRHDVINISQSSHCTIKQNTSYHSWRLNQTKARMATMIWIQ